MTTTTRKNAVRKSRKAVSVQEKFALTRKEMDAALIERSGEIDVVLTALLCGENPLLVGEPGTGKSFLLDSLMGWFGEATNKFSHLFSKHSQPDEIFGPIDVMGMKQGVYRRITTNRLPEAHFAFGDEVFKAGPAILNTLLKMMNERTFENGDGVERKCPLLIFVSASNEYPQCDELGALFDRFLFRVNVKPVSIVGRHRLLWERDHRPKLSTSITVDEVHEARKEAEEMDWTDEAKEALDKILMKLNSEGIRPGDRRMYKAIGAAQAYAYLCGAFEVEPEHLEILAHILWTDPEEHPEKCARIVARISNPVGHTLNEKLLQAKEIAETDRPTEAVPKLEAILEEVKLLQDHSRKAMTVAYVKEAIKRVHYSAIGVNA